MEAYNLPIKLREWFVRRLKQQLDAENESIKAASKGKKGTKSASTLGSGPSPPSLPRRPK